MSVRFSISLLLISAAMAGAAETNSPVRSLGHGLYQVGQVTLNISNRAVTFRGAVQMREETVEYAVVHKTGKTHESIFRTDAQPKDIHVAMLLLGARAVMTNLFGVDGKATPPGDKVSIAISWSNDQAIVHWPIEDLVMNKETKESLARGEWIYNGSNFSEGSFTAQRDGSIVSIHIDPDALINNPRPGRENDDLHVPFAARLPAIGTPVEITIRFNTKR